MPPLPSSLFLSVGYEWPLCAPTFSKTTLILYLENDLGRLTCLHAHSMLKSLSIGLPHCFCKKSTPFLLFSCIQYISGYLRIFSLSSFFGSLTRVLVVLKDLLNPLDLRVDVSLNKIKIVVINYRNIIFNLYPFFIPSGCQLYFTWPTTSIDC